MRRGIIALLLGTSILFVGCGDSADANKYVEDNTPKETINYSEVAEEYNSSKEYGEGDIVSYTGEVGKMYWNAGGGNNYHIKGCGVTWEESKSFNMGNVAKKLPFGGKVKVIGECYATSTSFFIRDFEILEVYSVTLDDYIKERTKMDTDGISKEEATKLNEWCNTNEECKIFEKALENNIYVLYPELNN